MSFEGGRQMKLKLQLPQRVRLPQRNTFATFRGQPELWNKFRLGEPVEVKYEDDIKRLLKCAGVDAVADIAKATDAADATDATAKGTSRKRRVVGSGGE